MFWEIFQITQALHYHAEENVWASIVNMLQYSI